MGSASEYSDPPWVFKGRALYQLQLVKLEEARKYIPRDLNIVSLFGYTLGGFYLARYSDSPVGPFDECVALAGTVWNKPTSCGWAARVFVNNRQARDHGRQHVGLPSRTCKFSVTDERGAAHQSDWWDQPLSRTKPSSKQPEASSGTATTSGRLAEEILRQAIVMHNTEKRPSWRPWARNSRSEGLKEPVCSFSGFPSAIGRHGPKIKLALPSFSGRTADCPGLLRYACQLQTNVRLVAPVTVACGDETSASQAQSSEDLRAILGGRPVLAIAFDNMEMVVQKPVSIVGKSVSREDEWEMTEPSAVPQLLGGT